MATQYYTAASLDCFIATEALVGRFHDARLLDEIIVQVGSVTLGTGKPLLPRRITNPSLKLVSVDRFGEGFAELRYEVRKA